METQSASPPPRPLILLGYRGCGKTTVGRTLADRLGWEFVDTDERIAAAAGCTIAEFFARHGEPEFRRLERDILAAVLAEPAARIPAATPASGIPASGITARLPPARVLSIGGGAVLDPANRAALKAAGRCIWLTAPAEELLRRTIADAHTAAQRPPLTAHEPLAEIRHLLAQREPLYAGLADHIVPTGGHAVADVVAAVLALLPVAAGR